MKSQILLYYKYVHIADPKAVMSEQRELCNSLHLKGRIIVSGEGINGTIEGSPESCQSYMNTMLARPEFAEMNFKKSEGTGSAFPRLSVKVRSEIVSASFGSEDVNPAVFTAKHLSPEKLHEWIHSDKEFYIVDMRNDYEHKVGFFKNSVLPPLKNFRDLPKILPQLEHLKNKTVVTVCTGGVRCEKASGFLLNHGFKDVYQLENGIVSYMEKYPNEDFLGKLYVFDGRVTMGFNTSDPKHVIVGKCERCGGASDNYVDCGNLYCKGNRHFICCENCQNKNGKAYCSLKCNIRDWFSGLTTKKATN
jgi:UPF0176 protein